ncbi:MAG: hypothetical protein HC908_19035 [Calothrix sp. SM1_7_51]|nr:hypothetical protein [Calothrix sp. SM1_7_51]
MGNIQLPDKNQNIKTIFFFLQRYFNRLGVSQKISLGYAITLAFALCGMLTGGLIIHSYQRQARELIDDAIEENTFVDNLKNNILEARTYRRGLAANLSQPSELAEEYSQFKNSIDKSLEAWSNLKSSYIEPEIEETSEESKAFGKLIKNYDGLIEKYLQETEEIIEQISRSKLEPSEVEKYKDLLINFSHNSVAVQLKSFIEDINELKEVVAEEK